MRGLYFILASVLAASAMIECSNDSSTCDAGSCVDAGVPSVSGGGCDSSKPASQGGCAVDDSDGFFVSPSGADTNAGTKAAPFKTIGAGITAAAAAAKQPNVYVCAGTYPENLVIKSAPAGVALHGGFDCTTWAQTNATTTVAPAWIPNATSQQYVLLVDATAALVEGMALNAPDAKDPSASSVAAFVRASPGMTFRRATVVAGAGADGVTPTPSAAVAAAMPGNNGALNVFAGAVTCACSSDSSIGGHGGGYVDGGVVNPEGGAPIVNGDNTKGQAGTASSGIGGNGADGLVGKTGTSTATLGDLNATMGWVPSPGGAGGVGGTAQGGGGGFYNLGNPTAGGGGGACGGCGGQGGGGGGGGGASIAIAALSSTVRVQTSTIRAGKAGNGADGGLGQAGQPGGTGGTGSPSGGGNGGTGGGGGPGGGGAGGVSIAIATISTTPDIDQQSTTLAGNAGAGGKDGSAAQTKAVDGLAAAVHAF